MSGPLCHCDPPKATEKRVAGSASKHHGREYWSCSTCDFFRWVDQPGTTLCAAGPPCRCGQASTLKVARTASNNGRSFWICARTGPAACRFFEWESADFPSSTPTASDRSCKKCKKAVEIRIAGKHNPKGNAGRKYYKCQACNTFEFVTAAKPEAPDASHAGSAEYVVDEITRRHLQRLFDVPFGTELGIGRDQQEESMNYDYLRVECAWRVKNAQREQRFKDFKQKLPDVPKDSRIQSNLFDAQTPLCSQLDASKNEMLLLHGTKPEHVHDILFEGLDPLLSKEGLFGTGTYLAEDAAKVDQYLTKDPEWKGNELEHELQPLHKKLYERGVKHATNIYYALVCRVALGEVAVTKDGETCAKTGKAIFQAQRRDALKKRRGRSLVAELGGKIERYREFVIFDPAALSVEFLVALKRVRHYCDCGQTAVQRTVTNGQPENFGRDILLCARRPSEGGCGFVRMLPQCYCERAAGVGFKKNGEKYFRCGSKRDFCDFKDWNFPAGKRQRGS
ncbi:NEIL3 [Symbiodinium sp. CCMP2592]|nr:NEIL3 [Symbiodinium sp. CCMP2592]